MGDLTDTKLWANSGDSHLMEPPDLFASLPDDIRERLPRSVKDPSGEFETIYIDGQEFRRDLPKGDKPKKGLGIMPAPPAPRRRTSSTGSSEATTPWHASRTWTKRASGAR